MRIECVHVQLTDVHAVRAEGLGLLEQRRPQQVADDRGVSFIRARVADDRSVRLIRVRVDHHGCADDGWWLTGART